MRNNYYLVEELTGPDGLGREMEEQQMSRKASAWHSLLWNSHSYHCGSSPSIQHIALVLHLIFFNMNLFLLKIIFSNIIFNVFEYIYRLLFKAKI